MFATVWHWNKCALLYLVAFAEVCNSVHKSSCEHETGFMSSFTCKRKRWLFKKCTFYLLNPSLIWTRLCGNQSPQLASIHPPRCSPQFRAASGQLQRIHFKGFGQTQNSPAEDGVSSFSRMSGVSASWGTLFPSLVLHTRRSKMWTAFMGGTEAAFTPPLNCAARGKSACER